MTRHTVHPVATVGRSAPALRARKPPLRQLVLLILTLVGVLVAGIATIHYNLTYVREKRGDNLFAAIVDSISNLELAPPAQPR